MKLTFSRLCGHDHAVAKVRPADLSLAEKLAEKFEPQIAKAVLDLLQAHGDMLDMDALLEALLSGQGDKVLAVVGAAADQAEAMMAGKMKDALQDAVWAAGIEALAAPGTAPFIGRAEFHFDRINPALTRWLQEYDLGLIKQISGTTRETIRDVLVENMRLGQGPIKQAQKIRDAIGLTTRQANAIGNFRKELETFHLKRSAASWGLGQQIDRVNGRQVFKPGIDGDPKDGILNRRLRDFRYDAALAKAQATKKPLTPAQIDKMVAAYKRKYLQFRSRTIARTESLRATNTGIQEAFRQAIEKGLLSEDLVRRRWVVAADERLCEVCAPVPGMNPPQGVKFAQPFATPVGPVMLPPLHPNCRCTTWIQTIEPPKPVNPA